MATGIYVMTHKEFEVPKDPSYIPLHVGREGSHVENKAENRNLCGKHDVFSNDGADGGTTAAKENPKKAAEKEPRKSGLESYVGDNTGDHISGENCYYSELTGLYWVWKNVHDMDYVGTCHYRRYLLNDQGYVFTVPEIEALLKTCDVITTRTLQLNYSYYEGFGENHKIYYLDETARVIRDLYPEYWETYHRLVHQNHTYFGNMLICSKKLYDAYMEWLFGILFELQSRIVIQEEDSYHRRIFGFISEFLQYVWIIHNGWKVHECMVGMLGEKAETAEIKNALGGYFAKGDYEGAKNYFLECRKKRPDILMEASDITGELHLCMQVIATAGLEQQAYGRNLLQDMRDFSELMHYCNKLNQYTIGVLHGNEDPSLARWIKDQKVSEVARKVSYQMFENHGQLKKLK